EPPLEVRLQPLRGHGGAGRTRGRGAAWQRAGRERRARRAARDRAVRPAGALRRAARAGGRRGGGGMSPGKDLGGVLDAHVGAEFETQDVDATMATMADDPYVWHVPTKMGGDGLDDVRSFYSSSFVGKWPADTKAEQIGRTVGESCVVE